MREGMRRVRALARGGRPVPWCRVSIAVTVTGEVAPGRVVRRDGARPGDRVIVTGELGGAAAGLGWQRCGRGPTRAARAGATHLRPTPRVGEAGVLARHGVRAMMDVSDGLAIDLSRLAKRRERRASPALPHHVPVPGRHVARRWAGARTTSCWPPSRTRRTRACAVELEGAFGVALTEIGRVVEAKGAGGLAAVDQNGAEAPRSKGRPKGGTTSGSW